MVPTINIDGTSCGIWSKDRGFSIPKRLWRQRSVVAKLPHHARRAAEVAGSQRLNVSVLSGEVVFVAAPRDACSVTLNE
jgi:hypothetical protein